MDGSGHRENAGKAGIMGGTVNFRSHKESYKDKKMVKNNSDENEK